MSEKLPPSNKRRISFTTIGSLHKQWRRRGQTLVKNKFLFYLRMLQLSKSVQYDIWSKNFLRLHIHQQHSILNKKHEKLAIVVRVRQIRRTWSFHVVVLQRMVKKLIKIQNARAEQLVCSLNLLFGDAFVAVAVVGC